MPAKFTKRSVTSSSAVAKALADRQKNVRFSSTGSALINCVISAKAKGGYPVGQMVNIVGDRSTGKTLLAIEACANFHIKFPKARIRYCEAEAAFDEVYAQTVGLPKDVVEFPNDEELEEAETKLVSRRRETDSDEEEEETEASKKKKAKRKGKVVAIETVEDVNDDLKKFCEESRKEGQPGLYIVDSWDALSSDAEMGREISDATYGGEKPRQTSQLFRRLVRRVKRAKVMLIIISQTRANIAVSFGKKWTRTGGKALDFYASQIIWLSEISKMWKTRKKERRPTGILVALNCDKNKVAPAYRTCEFPIIFNYGIDDIRASYDWLKLHEPTSFKELTGMNKVVPAVSAYEKMSRSEQKVHRKEIETTLQALWDELEEEFLPKRTPKYG